MPTPTGPRSKRTPKGRVRTTYFLAPELIRSIKIVAAMRGCVPSDVVEIAVREHLREETIPQSA